MLQPEATMARKAALTPEPIGDGPALAANLCRLGFGRMVVESAQVARIVVAKTGHAMSRQRVSALLNAVKITPKTIAVLAKALEVEPDELTRRGR